LASDASIGTDAPYLIPLYDSTASVIDHVIAGPVLLAVVRHKTLGRIVITSAGAYLHPLASLIRRNGLAEPVKLDRSLLLLIKGMR